MSTNLDGSRIVKIEDVKQGELVRKTSLRGTVYGTKVFIRGSYSRELKRYELQAYEDLGDFKYLKKGSLVLVDFEY